MKFGAGTFLNRKQHFCTFLNRKQHFHIQRRPKCYSDIPRTPSPMSSHQLHRLDYRDNVYIFTYTFYLYVLRTIRHPKHPKHPKRPKRCLLFSVRPLWPDLLIRLIPLYVYVLLIRLMLRAPLASPFNPYTYTFNLYVLLIRYTYTYYIYFILTCNTYILYLHLNVEFPSFFSNFLGNFLLLKIFPKYFAFIFLQNIFTPIFPKIFTSRRLLKFLQKK